MNFWWINHKQTFRQEFFGKYIWSPKRKRNDQTNPFYETMREVTARLSVGATERLAHLPSRTGNVCRF
jgi:hypothetical protein